MQIAFGDESCISHFGKLVYAYAFIVLDPTQIDVARDYVLNFTEKPNSRIHFRDLRPHARQKWTSIVFNGPWSIQVEFSSANSRNQERLRRKILAGLYTQSQESRWVLESRGTKADSRDLRLFQALAGRHHRRGPWVEHVHAQSEPLLWAADVAVSSSTASIIEGRPIPFPIASQRFT